MNNTEYNIQGKILLTATLSLRSSVSGMITLGLKSGIEDLLDVGVALGPASSVNSQTFTTLLPYDQTSPCTFPYGVYSLILYLNSTSPTQSDSSGCLQQIDLSQVGHVIALLILGLTIRVRIRRSTIHQDLYKHLRNVLLVPSINIMVPLWMDGLLPFGNGHQRLDQKKGKWLCSLWLMFEEKDVVANDGCRFGHLLGAFHRI